MPASNAFSVYTARAAGEGSGRRDPWRLGDAVSLERFNTEQTDARAAIRAAFDRGERSGFAPGLVQFLEFVSRAEAEAARVRAAHELEDALASLPTPTTPAL